MQPSFRRIRLCLSSLRLLPHIIFLTVTKDKEDFKKDVERWSDIHCANQLNRSPKMLSNFVEFMTFLPEFRNLFYLRFGTKARLMQFLCRPLSTLQIQSSASIGPGLFIQHGLSTLIAAERIGKNCWINQQVTIGYSNKTDRPIIGDNVTIGPGAKLIGKINVGNNVTVGPNTVLIDNVPSNVTVLGVPARIISRKPDVSTIG